MTAGTSLLSGQLWLLAVGESPLQDVSIVSPASPQARSIVDLGILTIAIAAIIFLIVEGVLIYTAWRFRQRREPPDKRVEPAQVYGSQPIEVAWTAAPALIVFFLTLVITRTLWSGTKVAQAAPRNEEANTLRVTVVGHQWWWEYRYETYDGRTLGFITANELHIPVSDSATPRLVHLQLESADVCHSFWTPRLAGKMDLIPGRTNHLAFLAEAAGLYVGQCAEYCGAQHAGMLLRVVVDTPKDFETWLANEAKPAVDDPAAHEGRDVFLSQSCVSCHRVRGTAADGNYAPDLTHLMSRQSLASGIAANDGDSLASWVHDPQAVKPGCLMPDFGLTEREQKLLVGYLETLR